MNILVVDDDEIIREVMKEVLVSTKIFSKVEIAKEGNEALSILKKEKTNILLTDINMPNGMGGFDLISEVQKMSLADKIYAFSGNSENQEPCLKLDIQGFYKKPIKDIMNFIKELSK